MLGAGSIVLLLLVWELLPQLVTLSAGTKLFFTTPSQIAGTLWNMIVTGTIWAPLGVSAAGFAIGLVLAIVVGLPLGVLLGRSRTLNAMFDPFITAFNATPRLVFLPLLMLWFGLGMWSKVVIVFIGALFPILINTYEGVRNADKVLINVVRSFGASEWDVARLVVVPNALPYIVAGLRLAIGRAMLGVVVAEFFGAEDGLGVVMVQAASRYQVDVVFAGLIVFAALSLIMTGLVQAPGKPPQPLAAAASRTPIDAQAAIAYDKARHEIRLRWSPVEPAITPQFVSVRADLGRDVVHLLERRIRAGRAAGTARDRAAACPSATGSRRSCRAGAIRRSRGTGPWAIRRRTTLCSSSQISPATLSLSMPRCSLIALTEPSLLVAEIHHGLGDGADEFLHGLGILVGEGLARDQNVPPTRGILSPGAQRSPSCPC